MVTLTLEQLQAIAPQGRSRVAAFLPHLNHYMPAYGIDTPKRAAAFLAQLAHESGSFLYVRELGGHAYLDKYDTGRLAQALGNTPEDDDDGQKYRGRGLIQITGRANYAACGKALGLDLLAKPELLEQPEHAVASACWFWSSFKGLNQHADKGAFVTITKRINGGMNGYSERLMFWERAKRALGDGQAA